MTHKAANPCFINDSSRCQHRTASRRRCRLRVVDSHSGLCFRHAQLHLQRLEVPDLSSDLVGQLSQFTSAADINQVLSKLLILLAQNRISPRRAAVIAYTTSLLLRTLPAIEHESGADSPAIIWDMPRPLREDEPGAAASACPPAEALAKPDPVPSASCALSASARRSLGEGGLSLPQPPK